MGRLSRYGVWVASAVAAAVGGCTASDFKPPVQAFSAAAKTASANLADYEKILDQAAFEAAVTSVARGESFIVQKRGECIPKARRCQLLVEGRDGKKGVLALQPVAPLIRGIMTGVVAYANALEAIATANTTAQIKTAAEAAKGNLVGLAQAVDALNAQRGRSATKLTPAISSFATPVTDAVVFGLSLYVESVKLDALRYATTTMNEIFPEMTALFALVADSGAEFKRREFQRAFEKASDDYDRNKQDRAKIEALVAAAQQYDAALSLDTTIMFRNLQDAHAALTKALSMPEPNFETVWPLLQRVSEQAGRLAEIAQGLQKAAEAN